MKNFFLFFLILISFIVLSSIAYSREAPIVLTYSLPEDNPDITIEKKGFDLFATTVPKSEFTEGESITITSKDLTTWNSVCDNPRLVLNIYKNSQEVLADFDFIPKTIGDENIGQYDTTISSGLSVGTYEALYYVWCADSYSTFNTNNACETFWVPNPTGLCLLYKNGEHKISNAESVIFTVNSDCIPQTEVCDDVDNDCDGQIDEGNVCETGSNNCESGDMRCFGDKIQTCGNYDSDSWLEYPTDGSGLTCGEGCESLGSGAAQCNTEPTGCAMDTKTCPDGSTVSRDPDNNCEFKTCPTVTNGIIEPELSKIYVPFELNWDNTPPAIGLGIKNKNNFEIKRKVEMFYVAKGNTWYDTYLKVLQEAGSLQAILSQVPEIEESSSCVSEDKPKQTVTVTLKANQEITFWMSPDLPKESLLFDDNFGKESNYNKDGDYLLYAGVYRECNEPHQDVIGKIVKLKSITVPKESCTDNNIDDDQDGLIDWKDDDCGVTPPPKCGDGTCGSGETEINCPSDCDVEDKGKPSLTLEEIKEVTSVELEDSLCSRSLECRERTDYEVSCTGNIEILDIVEEKIGKDLSILILPSTIDTKVKGICFAGVEDGEGIDLGSTGENVADALGITGENKGLIGWVITIFLVLIGFALLQKLFSKQS